eukprot:COSAG05_NODE_10322_length_571_cov_1.394068_1_plen_34_part_10
MGGASCRLDVNANPGWVVIVAHELTAKLFARPQM